MTQSVVSVGDLVLDITLPVQLPIRAGEFQEPTQRRVEPGGAANFMIAARRLGLDVYAAGTVGDDCFGKQIVDVLKRERIDISYVVSMPGSTSTLVIALTDPATGEHTFIGHYGSGGDVSYPGRLDRRIDKSDALFLAGYTLAEERVVPMARRAVECALDANVPVLLDVGPFMATVPPDLIRWVVERAHIMLMTDDEVPFAAGGQSGEAAYRTLLNQGPSTLVIKHGPGGCSLVTADGLEHVPGFDVEVVDTVGAGDCFAGAFTAGLLRGLDLFDAAQLANAMGAAVVQRVGAGSNAPTCADVLAILRRAGIESGFSC
ncbi:MAG: carbohydrate kinase family protein [Anaerolineae bacterium]|nr:carbohydrate kinase family protein [Anaerolineae bacterium]